MLLSMFQRQKFQLWMSAAPFVFLLQSAGIQEQDAEKIYSHKAPSDGKQDGKEAHLNHLMALKLILL